MNLSVAHAQEGEAVIDRRSSPQPWRFFLHHFHGLYGCPDDYLFVYPSDSNESLGEASDEMAVRSSGRDRRRVYLSPTCVERVAKVEKIPENKGDKTQLV